MQRILAFSVVGLLTALALLFFLFRSDPEPGPGPSRGAEPKVTPHLEAEPTVDAPASSALDSRPFTKEEADQQPITTPAEGGDEVRVLDAVSGEPIPGADVWVLTGNTSGSGAIPTAPVEAEVEDFVRRRGKRYQADDSGVARVEKTGEFTVIHARHGALSRTRAFRGTEPPFLLELVAWPKLRVRAVNPEGRPVAGIPLRVGIKSEPTYRWRLLRTTDASGVANFSLELLGLDALPTEPIAVVADIMATQLPQVAFAAGLASIPSEPVGLALPPLGQLHVEIEGEAPGEGCFTYLRLSDLPDFRRNPADDPRFAIARLSIASGKTTYPHVELDRQVSVMTDGYPGAIELEAEGDGPTTGSPATTLILTKSTKLPLLSGRLLTTAGESLGAIGIKLRLGWVRGEHTSTFELAAETGTDGRFEALVPEGWHERDELLLSTVASTPGSAIEGQCARAKIPGPITGPRDLGDLRFADLPVLAQGRILDQTGQPLLDVLIDARERQGEERDPWFEQVGDPCESKDGEFTIFGECDGKLIALVARKSGYVMNQGSPLVPPGTRGITINLTLAGSVTGSFQNPNELVRQARLRLLSETARSADSLNLLPEPYAMAARNGEFHFFDLLPGRYTFLVSSPGGRELARFEGLEVEGGSVCRDPRLQRIDLSGLAQPITITVLLPSGEPCPGARVWELVGRRGGGRWTDRQGRITLLMGKEPLDIRVQAPRYASVEFKDVRNDLVVTLKPALRISVETVNFQAMAGERLIVLLRPLGQSDSRRIFQETHEEVVDGKSVTFVDRPGRHQVIWNLQTETEAFSMPEDPNHQIEVAASDHIQSFRVTLGDAALRKIEEARRPR